MWSWLQGSGLLYVLELPSLKSEHQCRILNAWFRCVRTSLHVFIQVNWIFKWARWGVNPNNTITMWLISKNIWEICKLKMQVQVETAYQTACDNKLSWLWGFGCFNLTMRFCGVHLLLLTSLSSFQQSWSFEHLWKAESVNNDRHCLRVVDPVCYLQVAFFSPCCRSFCQLFFTFKLDLFISRFNFLIMTSDFVFLLHLEMKNVWEVEKRKLSYTQPCWVLSNLPPAPQPHACLALYMSLLQPTFSSSKVFPRFNLVLSFSRSYFKVLLMR